MWPLLTSILWKQLPKYASVVLLPVAMVIGVIGISVEESIRPHKEMGRPSIVDVREARLAREEKVARDERMNRADVSIEEESAREL